MRNWYGCAFKVSRFKQFSSCMLKHKNAPPLNAKKPAIKEQYHQPSHAEKIFLPALKQQQKSETRSSSLLELDKKILNQYFQVDFECKCNPMLMPSYFVYPTGRPAAYLMHWNLICQRSCLHCYFSHVSTDEFELVKCSLFFPSTKMWSNRGCCPLFRDTNPIIFLHIARNAELYKRQLFILKANFSMGNFLICESR